MLADHVETINQKAYVMAGGWDVLYVNQPPPIQHKCGILASFMVPWNETNEQHGVSLEVLDPDGESIAKIHGQLEAVRPAGISHGQEQRLFLGVNLGLTIPKLGPYVVKATAEGTVTEIRFSAIAGPGLAAAMAQRPPGL
jgi:hypothetical protein